jgi:Leucine-rich repeat (LRR) protein
MNVRALAASGQIGTSKSSSTQADAGRARASWSSKKTTVSFSTTRQELEPLPVEAAATPKVSTDLLQGKPESVKSIIGVKVTSPNVHGGSAGNLIGSSTGPAFDETDAIDQTLLEERLQSGAWEKLPHWKCALVELYKKLGGPGWRERGGWPSAEHVPTGSVPIDEELFGVSRPFNKRHEVSSLDLAWNNLAGDLSTVVSLWGMSGLEVLSLGANKLTGVLPGLELKKLPRLRELHLYRNSLRGHIPPELGSLRHLTSLWLFENHLTGPLPDELGQLGELVDLKLNSNRLTGMSPNAFLACRHMQRMPALHCLFITMTTKKMTYITTAAT